MAGSLENSAKVAESIDGAVAGRTVTSAFAETVAARRDVIALRQKSHGNWSTWTWTEYADTAARVAHGLRELGVERGQRVLLDMRNRPEFHMVDMAALLLGATPFSVYTSSPPAQLRYVAQHSEASIAIVESPELLERLLQIRDDLPALRHVVIVDDPEHMAPADVVDFSRLVDRTPIDWETAARAAEPTDHATVVYTSGTTGPPKGVLITHRNVCWTVESVLRRVGHDLAGRRCVSYLPMAHIAERMVSHYLHSEQGTEVTTCANPGLIASYLRDVHPQLFFAVPRVWEKARATIEALGTADPARADAFRAAVDVGRRVVAARVAGDEVDAETYEAWQRAEAEVFSVLRLMIGLDECELAVSAAAPIPSFVVEFFLAIGVPIAEIYGLSEACGPLTWSPGDSRPGSVGAAIPGAEVRCAPDGEVLARGGNVFAGYLKDPAKTDEVLDAEGWLHTGDVGHFENGQLRIVDRKKDLIVTEGGENISPSNLEGGLRACPLVSQACVIGDGRPYLVALVALDVELALTWARQQHIEAQTLNELAENPVVRGEIQRTVDAMNAAVLRVSQIKHFTVLGQEWVADSEELTPTMKLRRHVIHTRYAAEIDALYRADHETT